MNNNNFQRDSQYPNYNNVCLGIDNDKRIPCDSDITKMLNDLPIVREKTDQVIREAGKCYGSTFRFSDSRYKCYSLPRKTMYFQTLEQVRMCVSRSITDAQTLDCACEYEIIEFYN